MPGEIPTVGPNNRLSKWLDHHQPGHRLFGYLRWYPIYDGPMNFLNMFYVFVHGLVLKSSRPTKMLNCTVYFSLPIYTNLPIFVYTRDVVIRTTRRIILIICCNSRLYGTVFHAEDLTTLSE